MYEKTTINLREGDYTYIMKQAEEKGVKAAALIRYIISSYVDNMRRDPEILESLLDEVVL